MTTYRSKGKRRGGLTKTQAIRRHAIRRAGERYGVDLSPKMHGELSAAIRANNDALAIFAERQSRNKTMWFVKLEQHWTLAIYDKIRGRIVTFLPTSCELSERGAKWTLERHFLSSSARSADAMESEWM
jgi:hypothetical protein